MSYSTSAVSLTLLISRRRRCVFWRCFFRDSLWYHRAHQWVPNLIESLEDGASLCSVRDSLLCHRAHQLSRLCRIGSWLIHTCRSTFTWNMTPSHIWHKQAHQLLRLRRIGSWLIHTWHSTFTCNITPSHMWHTQLDWRWLPCSRPLDYGAAPQKRTASPARWWGVPHEVRIFRWVISFVAFTYLVLNNIPKTKVILNASLPSCRMMRCDSWSSRNIDEPFRSWHLHDWLTSI